MTTDEKLQALKTPLLYESAIRDAERTVTISRGPGRAIAEAELAALRARWESEAPARALRAELWRAGVRKSDHGPGWIRKGKDGRWVKMDDAALVAWMRWQEGTGLPEAELVDLIGKAWLRLTGKAFVKIKVGDASSGKVVELELPGDDGGPVQVRALDFLAMVATFPDGALEKIEDEVMFWDETRRNGIQIPC